LFIIGSTGGFRRPRDIAVSKALTVVTKSSTNPIIFITEEDSFLYQGGGLQINDHFSALGSSSL
jgi:hypothetical protein